MTAVPHVLIVTADPNEDPADPDFYDYAIECPGVTDRCRAWVACNVEDCQPTAVGALRLAHGQRHRHILGAWMVPTDTCYVQNHDGMPDNVAGSFGPGRHEVDFDIDVPDDGDIQIFAVGVKS